MLIGYARVSKADGSQSLDLQKDALIAAGVGADQIYSDQASGKKDDRPGLEACLKALRESDVLVIWKLDRMGRSLNHLIKTTTMLSERSVGLKVLTGQGAQIDTTTAAGRLRNRQFFSIEALNAAIAELLDDLNARTMRRVGRSRRQLFEEIERPALGPLPEDHILKDSIVRESFEMLLGPLRSTGLEAEIEPLAHGLATILQRRKVALGKEVDRTADKIGALAKSHDGSEIAETALEEAQARFLHLRETSET